MKRIYDIEGIEEKFYEYRCTASLPAVDGLEKARDEIEGLKSEETISFAKDRFTDLGSRIIEIAKKDSPLTSKSKNKTTIIHTGHIVLWNLGVDVTVEAVENRDPVGIAPNDINSISVAWRTNRIKDNNVFLREKVTLSEIQDDEVPLSVLGRLKQVEESVELTEKAQRANLTDPYPYLPRG